MAWGNTTYKHNAPHKGTLGYEISTSCTTSAKKCRTR
jgi:hypothetical protein